MLFFYCDLNYHRQSSIINAGYWISANYYVENELHIHDQSVMNSNTMIGSHVHGATYQW